jgi:hypothetical protein
MSFAEQGPNWKKFYSKRNRHPVNERALNTFLADVDVAQRHLDSHLEVSRERLLSNILALEDHKFSGATWDNAYTIGLKLLCVVLKRYGEIRSLLKTIRAEGSRYPKVPQSQLDRIRKFI